MRTKSIFLTVLVSFVPFLFVVNILRVYPTGNPDNYLGLYSFLDVFSRIDISFSATYVHVAEIVTEWSVVGSGNFFENIYYFFEALWVTLNLPVTILVDLAVTIMSCVQLFFELVGFIPG